MSARTLCRHASSRPASHMATRFRPARSVWRVVASTFPLHAPSMANIRRLMPWDFLPRAITSRCDEHELRRGCLRGRRSTVASAPQAPRSCKALRAWEGSSPPAPAPAIGVGMARRGTARVVPLDGPLTCGVDGDEAACTSDRSRVVLWACSYLMGHARCDSLGKTGLQSLGPDAGCVRDQAEVVDRRSAAGLGPNAALAR